MSSMSRLNFEYKLNFPSLDLTAVLDLSPDFFFFLSDVIFLVTSWQFNSDVAETAANNVTDLNVVINASF